MSTTSRIAKKLPGLSRIPTSDRDSGTHSSRSSSVSNLTTASDSKSECGDAVSEKPIDFSVGDKVWVNGTKPGILKFLGKTQFSPGLWAGIMLDEAVGKNDGSVDGTRYFQCAAKRGIFARPHRLTRTVGLPPAIGEATSPRSHGVNMSFGNASPITPKVCSRLKVGQMVTVAASTGVKKGILRYMGETEFAKGDWAGIELDEPTGKNDGTVAGKRYFQCRMKHGLFAPMHKVSNLGGTSTPRSTSSMGSRLKSLSKESLNSSVSTCSAASRSSHVRLGVTSLSGAQKSGRSPGSGIVTNSRALEEMIKEKEKHIEQLLQERELERTQAVTAASQCEEVEKKLIELKEREEKMLQVANLYEKSESDRKSLENQLSQDHRKLEDLQFQMEEQLVMKTDIEVQLQQRNKILQQLENFVNAESGDKSESLRKILKGEEYISDSTTQNSTKAENVTEKLSQLEKELQNAMSEKNDVCNDLKKAQDQLSEIKKAKDDLENAVASANKGIQEKDDAIFKMTEELKSANEKAVLLAENKENLSLDFSRQTTELQQQSSDTIKQLEEKNLLLNGEVQKLIDILREKTKLIEEKGEELSGLDNHKKDLESQVTQQKTFIQVLEKKLEVSENEKAKIQDVNATTFAETQLEFESEMSKMKEKNASLSAELESLNGILQEKTKQIEEKGEALSGIDRCKADLESQLSQQKSFIETLEQKLKKSAAENAEIQKTNTATSEQARTHFETEISKMQKENASLHEELKKLNILLQEKTNSIEASTQEVCTLNSSKRDLESQASLLQSSIQELELKLKHGDSESARISQINNETIERMKSESESNISRINEEKNKISEELNSTMEKFKFQSNLAADRETQIAALKESLSNKDLECSKFSAQLQDMNEKYRLLIQEKGDKENSLSQQLKNFSEEQSQRLTEKQEEIQKLQSEIKRLGDIDVEKNSQLLKSNSERDSLAESMENRCKEFTQKIAELEEAKKQLQLKNDEDSSNLSILQSKLSELSNQSEQMKVNFEKELKDAKEKYEKSLQTVRDTEVDLNASREAADSLQNEGLEFQKTIADLESQITRLQQDAEILGRDKTESQAQLQTQLANIRSEAEAELKKKEMTIESLKSEAVTSSELIKSKDAEVVIKEKEISRLKAMVQEKDSQFDSLTSMIESSQTQLSQLKQQNESNLALLQSKEVFINEFKGDQEKQLLQKQQTFNEEIKKANALVRDKEEEIIRHEANILSLTAHQSDYKKQIASLQSELEKQKSEKDKMMQESNNFQTELQSRINDLEVKYNTLMEEKEKIANEELATKEAKKGLEQMRDSLLEKNVHHETLVMERESKIQALQAEVIQMQAQFAEHRHDLQQKLDISDLEIQASRELKHEMEVQHGVLEELQQELVTSEEKCKALEEKIAHMSEKVKEKTALEKQLEDAKKLGEKYLIKINESEEKNNSLDSLNSINQNLLQQNEKEVEFLKRQLESLEKSSKSHKELQSSLNLVNEENLSLRNKIKTLEASHKVNSAIGSATASNENDQEKESLLSQVDFLNSIIVDMKRKNEELTKKMEEQSTSFEDFDFNLNDQKKQIPPRCFCDICDVFDLHETEDCPKQESFEEELPRPKKKKRASREERPYCENCEMFGHWTSDCAEPETF